MSPDIWKNWLSGSTFMVWNFTKQSSNACTSSAYLCRSWKWKTDKTLEDKTPGKHGHWDKTPEFIFSRGNIFYIYSSWNLFCLKFSGVLSSGVLSIIPWKCPWVIGSAICKKLGKGQLYEKENCFGYSENQVPKKKHQLKVKYGWCKQLYQ